MLRISEVSARRGVPTSTLRYYDRLGLLPSRRTPAGYRVYDQDDLDRLDFICAAKSLGLPLKDVTDLMRVWESSACGQVRATLRPQLAAALRDAREHIAELHAAVAVLSRAVAQLETLPDRAGRCDPSCTFLINSADGWPLPLAPDVGASPVAIPEVAGSVGAPGPVTVACSLGSSEEVRERVERWRELLAQAPCTRTPAGWSWSLALHRAADAAALAAAEQQCCPFFEFVLQLESGTLCLEVRAAGEASTLLAEVFPLPSTDISVYQEDPA